jgi:hypothetical protein
MAAAGLAPERTWLAWDRTALSAAALAAVLIKVGVAHSRPADVVAGGCAVVTAVVIGLTGRARARSLSAYTAVLACTGLVSLTAVLTVVALILS